MPEASILPAHRKRFGTMTIFKNRRVRFLIVIVVSLMLFVGHFLNISFEKPAGDQRHYLAFAYNSLKHGVFDDARTDRPRPDNRRPRLTEPSDLWI